MKKPSSAAVLFAVLFTAIFTLFAFNMILDAAKTEYARTHQLAVYERSILFFTWKERQEVTIGMLSGSRLWIGVIVPTALYFVLHPLIGRGVSAVLDGLAKQLSVAMDPDKRRDPWIPDVHLLLGAAWPLTMLAIPFQAAALVLVNVYRSLWSGDGEA